MSMQSRHVPSNEKQVLYPVTNCTIPVKNGVGVIAPFFTLVPAYSTTCAPACTPPALTSPLMVSLSIHISQPTPKTTELVGYRFLFNQVVRGGKEIGLPTQPYMSCSSFLGGPKRTVIRMFRWDIQCSKLSGNPDSVLRNLLVYQGLRLRRLIERVFRRSVPYSSRAAICRRT